MVKITKNHNKVPGKIKCRRSKCGYVFLIGKKIATKFKETNFAYIKCPNCKLRGLVSGCVSGDAKEKCMGVFVVFENQDYFKEARRTCICKECANKRRGMPHFSVEHTQEDQKKIQLRKRGILW